MSTAGLAHRLTQKVEKGYGPEDPDWVQFVADHKFYLREKSTISRFAPIDLVKYRYRPVEFYKDNRGDASQVWIFLMVNDLRDYSDFNESITHLWMVDPDEIKKLRRLYESSVQYQAKSA